MERLRSVLSKITTTLLVTTAYPLFYLSHLSPRSKHVWIFIGWHRGNGVEIFADNTKYLFLHIAHTRKDLRPVWIAKDRILAKHLRTQGYCSHYEKSVRGIWYALRAGTTVIDAFLQTENFRWSGRTRLIQLLHGKGMKKGGYAQKPLRKQDYIFSTSPLVSSMLPAVFVQQSPVLVTGYSRGDVFFKEIAGSDIGVDKSTERLLNNPAFKKRLLYAPTYRRGSKTLSIDTMLDLKHLSAWLSEHEYLLVIHLHPKYRDQARALSYPNIHLLEDSDIYPLLASFDVLINDYSSIFTDFLLLDRPIVFYPYDLKTYIQKEGLSFENYDDYTPGPKAYTPDELMKVLDTVTTRDAWGVERRRVRDLYHTYQDGNASERIMRVLQPQQ